jgi:hypothetical protein
MGWSWITDCHSYLFEYLICWVFLNAKFALCAMVTIVACILPPAPPMAACIRTLTLTTLCTNPSSLTHLTPLLISGESACHRPRVESAWCYATLHSKFRGSNSHAGRARVDLYHECAEQGPNPFRGMGWATSARPVFRWYATRTWAQSLGVRHLQSHNPAIAVAPRWRHG